MAKFCFTMKVSTVQICGENHTEQSYTATTFFSAIRSEPIFKINVSFCMYPCTLWTIEKVLTSLANAKLNITSDF